MAWTLFNKVKTRLNKHEDIRQGLWVYAITSLFGTLMIAPLGYLEKIAYPWLQLLTWGIVLPSFLGVGVVTYHNLPWRSKNDLTQGSQELISVVYQSTTEKKDKEETLLASLLSHFGIWHGVATFFGTRIPSLPAIGSLNHSGILSDSQANEALMTYAPTIPSYTADPSPHLPSTQLDTIPYALLFHPHGYTQNISSRDSAPASPRSIMSI